MIKVKLYTNDGKFLIRALVECEQAPDIIKWNDKLFVPSLIDIYEDDVTYIEAYNIITLPESK